MAIDIAPVAGPSRPADPILQEVAERNTFECDWNTLRDHIRLGLEAAVPLFIARGPRKAYVHPQPKEESSNAIASSPPVGPAPELSNAAPPSDSLLLSPDRPTTNLETGQFAPAETPDESMQERSAPIPAVEGSEYRASTPGGLVVPPFPPLDPSRKRGNGVAALGTGGPAGPKVNGHVNRFEDDWDEEVVIGGKILPGWMEEAEERAEVDRVVKMLDDMDEPPFTVQRIAELLLSPTSSHSSLGKFLRAIEKCLLVTSTWEPPSYDPEPLSLFSASQAFPASSISSSPARSTVSMDDEESMMPRGSATPMFSPIAFLPRDDADGGDMDVDLPPGQEQRLEDGLMSPLMLGGESSPNPATGGFQFAPSPQVRSPTPEPEPGSSKSPPCPRAAQNESHDPGHQSYLGRVDELDTGPVKPSPTAGEGNAEDGAQGAGEGGNMVQHGMSDKPVPLSSTTVVKDEERKIAPIPKTLEERFTSGSAESEKKEVKE